MGIEFKDLSVMVHVKTHIGTTYVCGSQGKIVMNDVWSPIATAYPAQGVVSQIVVHKDVIGQHKKVETLFPVNSTIFFVGNPYFGSEGIVLNPLLVYECGRLKINITVLPEPDFADAKYTQTQLESDYVNSYQASAIIGLHAKCLGRITGTVLVVAGARRSNIADNIAKTNIGLQLKFPKQQEERAGYARRINNQWYYSSKAIALVQSYCDKFPMIIEHMSKSSDRSEFCFESDLFPNSVGESCVEEIVSWIKVQDHMKTDRISCGSKTVEKEAIEKVLDSIEKLKTLPVKTVKLQVKPHLLLKPDISLPDMYKAKRPVRLFDRVVIVKTTYMVPLGSKGTVVGIYPVFDPNPVRLECVKTLDNFFEVLFDKHLPNGNDIHGIAQERVYKVPESSVLLILNQDSKQIELFDSKTTRVTNDTLKKKELNSSTMDLIKSNINKPSNVKSILHSEKNSLNAQSKETNDDRIENFWMPAVNETFKHATMPLPQLAINEIHNAKTTVWNTESAFKNSYSNRQNNSIPNECQTGTQVLKSLLGLSQSNPNSSKTFNTPDQFIDLPQPPENWRNNNRNPCSVNNTQYVNHISQKCHQDQNNLAMNSFSMMHQSPVAIFGGNPMPIANQQQTYAHSNSTFNLQQQSSSYSPGRLSQKSAFIPLQGNRNTPTFHTSINIVNSDKNEENMTNASTIGPSCSKFITMPSESVQAINSNQSDDLNIGAFKKPNDTRKKTPRTPKIGAKFDFAH